MGNDEKHAAQLRRRFPVVTEANIDLVVQVTQFSLAPKTSRHGYEEAQHEQANQKADRQVQPQVLLPGQTATNKVSSAAPWHVASSLYRTVGKPLVSICA